LNPDIFRIRCSFDAGKAMTGMDMRVAVLASKTD